MNNPQRPTDAGCVDAREAAAVALGAELYGSSFDPFDHPEGLELSTMLSNAAIDAFLSASGGDAAPSFDRQLSAICDEGWKFHSGPPPEYDSPLSQVYDAGIGYAWDRLAELLGVTDYEGGDGSEDYATDVANTGRNILVAAGYTNSDGDLLTAPDIRASGGDAAELAAADMREALEDIRLIVEDDAYKVTEGQQPCKHTAALNEVHAVASAALALPLAKQEQS